MYKTKGGSVYEVDRDNKRVRRVSGTKPPHHSFPPDGVWRSFEDCAIYSNRLMIQWAFDQVTVTNELL